MSFQLGPSIGLMQQPASQYQHLYSGVWSEMGFFDRFLLVRAGWFERPQFEDNGYADQDSGFYALLGTEFDFYKSLKLDLYLGSGEMSGYTKTTSGSEPIRRGYRMKGIVTSAQILLPFGKFVLGLQHRSFSGYVDSEELEAWVGWPFTFFEISLGFAL